MRLVHICANLSINPGPWAAFRTRKLQYRHTMNEYRHHVSGIFAVYQEADSARSRLIEQGLPRERIQIFATRMPHLIPQRHKRPAMPC